MFGWEFPPHITGGLGTACYGLTKALSSFDDMDISFVVPKAYGDEDKSVANIVNAESIAVDENLISEKQNSLKVALQEINKKEYTKEKNDENIFNRIKYIEIYSLIKPYLSPEQFEKYFKNEDITNKEFTINKEGKIVYLIDGKEVELKLPSDFYQKHNKTFFKFSGQYGFSLINEVFNYSIIGREIAKTDNFDIIHAHDWLTYPAGVEAKKILGKKLLIHVHATEFDRSGENINSVVFEIEKYGMLNADKIIAVSELTRQTIINRYSIDQNKVEVVHNAVVPIESENQFHKKNINEKIVTFLGRITFQKGPDYFIEAAYKVLQKTDNVRFVMAGNGDMLYRMIKRAAKLKITDKFHFTDFLKGDDVEHLFSISDVYVMPSVSEPFGISPLEAMRSNVPVIISKQSGVAEVLHHAIKVDFWDIDAIADSIYGLIKYDGLSKMFIKYGKTEVDKLKWENSALKVKQIYEKMM
ncbi:MAG: glycosyltransferase [Bacteroidales bacterium]|nr:glycosyltransferase [Bacteroidales bacterium]MBN2757862.1 glycosyltransferase [Bacteroidales bacterium]